MSLMETTDSVSFIPPPFSVSSLENAMSTLVEEGRESISDLKALKNQRELRHRLFFHHQEWEFGPALLTDNIQLARAQSKPQKALAYYEEARSTAKALVENFGESAYVPAWLEINRILAEIYSMIEQPDQSVFYAREGLMALKRGQFEPEMDPFITKLTVRFWDLLGRMPV